MNAEQDGLDKGPSIPQGLPAGEAITLASEKATKTGDGTTERANRPLTWRALIQQSQDIKNLLGNDLCGRQIGKKKRQLSQPKQAHPNRRQDGEQIFQCGDGMHAAIFQATATFEHFMKLF